MAADERETHRDPITDDPGAPAVGTIVGGLTSQGAAAAVNPTAEEAHWRAHYSRALAVEPGRSFEDYRPAYRHGLEGRLQHVGDWDTAEPRLASHWDRARGSSPLSWDQARPASRAAWEHADSLQAPADNAPDLPGGAASSSDAVDTLQDLAACARDGEQGFRTCAERAGRQDLKSLFLQRADACRRDAEALDDCIREMGGVPETGGSALGAVHRGWTAVKTALGSNDDLAVLEEAERGEDNALARYRKARMASLPGNLRSLVERQHQGVQRSHDDIRRLRDQAQQQHGALQSPGNDSGSRDGLIDVLQDLAQVCRDGEYGFRASAGQARRPDLQSLFNQRADDCCRAAEALDAQISRLGGAVETGGSAMGAVHRGWVSVKAKLRTQDDRAVLEECERAEDNALARYRKALGKPLPADVRQLVEHQLQGVQRNHDQIRMLRDSTPRR